MRRRARYIALSLALAGATAGATRPNGEIAFSRESQDVRVALGSENGSEEAGTAVLTPRGAQTRVTIFVAGEPAGAAQPANIHAGRCGAVEIIMYQLQYVRNGRSTSLLDVPLDRLKATHLLVNLQESVASLHAPKDARDVSCGEIRAIR